MAKKNLNVIYCEKTFVFEYSVGTEFEAFKYTMKGFFNLHDSNIYLTNPESNNVVVWSSNLPDATTVILHAAADAKPDIEDDDKIDEESTASEHGETTVSWPGSSEHSSDEDDLKENTKKKYEDEEQMETVTKRQRLTSSSSSEIFNHIPLPPLPPARCRCVRDDGIPIPPPPVARKVRLNPNTKG